MPRSRGSGNTTIGSRTKTLKDGERKALELLRDATDKFGDDDPIIQECTMMLICISRADTGYTGRHIGSRLRAIHRLLDQRLGKPGDAPPRGGQVVQPAKFIFEEIKGVGLPDTDDI